MEQCLIPCSPSENYNEEWQNIKTWKFHKESFRIPRGQTTLNPTNYLLGLRTCGSLQRIERALISSAKTQCLGDENISRPLFLYLYQQKRTEFTVWSSTRSHILHSSSNLSQRDVCKFASRVCIEKGGKMGLFWNINRAWTVQLSDDFFFFSSPCYMAMQWYCLGEIKRRSQELNGSKRSFEIRRLGPTREEANTNLNRINIFRF